MDRSKKVVFSFLNSAEGYFHTKTVVEDSFKQPRDLYGPMSNRPERWDYTDVRDISSCDLARILDFSCSLLDKKLFKLIPSVAISAALQTAIHTLDNGRFQSKIDSNVYKLLCDVLCKKFIKGDSK